MTNDPLELDSLVIDNVILSSLFTLGSFIHNTPILPGTDSAESPFTLAVNFVFGLYAIKTNSCLPACPVSV